VLFFRLALFLIFCFLSHFSYGAGDSESDREKIVAPRVKRFYRNNSINEYIGFGGKLTSDQNSKEKEINARYFYQSNRLISELTFLSENYYSNASSTKKYLVKKKELYDFSAAIKARIYDSRNYATFYHRTIYDDLSDYYYDIRNVVGLGRGFFNDKLEFDAGVGYSDVKNYGQKFNFVPSMRFNFKLSERFTLNNRSYLFIDHESMDNEVKTSLIYRIGPKLSIELRHLFEQRRYDDNAKRIVVNEVNKSITFGLVYDLR